MADDNLDLKAAIRSGDADALRRILSDEPSRANALIRWGKNDCILTHPLIGAASLGAENVGIRLLEAGANPNLPGMFGETALHWAALLGEDQLAARLVKVVTDLDLKDDEYKSSPLGWAIHGWCNPPAGNHGRQREVAALLVAAGARVEPQWLEPENARGADPGMLAVLRGSGRAEER